MVAVGAVTGWIASSLLHRPPRVVLRVVTGSAGAFLIGLVPAISGSELQSITGFFVAFTGATIALTAINHLCRDLAR
jgi:uncharacterized membrane protein YeaQ/YmgE (transglycosylase-associated protein family)